MAFLTECREQRFGTAGEMTARQIEFPLTVAVCAWCRPREVGTGVAAWSHGICPRHLRMMKLEVQRLIGATPRCCSRPGRIPSPREAESLSLPL